MQGATAGEVVESRHPNFASGDTVVAPGGWQAYAALQGNAAGLRKVDTTSIPLPAHLGVAGMPGVTAWFGLMTICEPEAGQTVVVSAASGAVGSVVGAIGQAAWLPSRGNCRWSREVQLCYARARF